MSNNDDEIVIYIIEHWPLSSFFSFFSYTDFIAVASTRWLPAEAESSSIISLSLSSTDWFPSFLFSFFPQPAVKPFQKGIGEK